MMVNEFVCCPRLFFHEWVEGLFSEIADTIEGAAQQKRVDARASELPAPGEADEKIHARSVTLSSEPLRVIAKLDLVEAEGQSATRSITSTARRVKASREGKDGAVEMWPPDRVQLALQAIVLQRTNTSATKG